MDKIEVNGDNAHPLWSFLRAQTGESAIGWNFSKFLITRNGYVYSKYEPAVEPLLLAPDIERLLNDNKI